MIRQIDLDPVYRIRTLNHLISQMEGNLAEYRRLESKKGLAGLDPEEVDRHIQLAFFLSRDLKRYLELNSTRIEGVVHPGLRQAVEEVTRQNSYRESLI